MYAASDSALKKLLYWLEAARGVLAEEDVRPVAVVAVVAVVLFSRNQAG